MTSTTMTTMMMVLVMMILDTAAHEPHIRVVKKPLKSQLLAASALDYLGCTKTVLAKCGLSLVSAFH